MTEGDIRWIKRHTKKTLKGIDMKQTKKRPAKKTDNPIIGKLLKLKYRINDTAKEEHGWSDDMSTDKRYVQSLINDIRKHNFTKIAPEDAHCCNGLWKRYA
tara:strand:- start:410 stop:712 length:303 start_codon:yes stop_codon:yes gene_type:complete